MTDDGLLLIRCPLCSYCSNPSAFSASRTFGCAATRSSAVVFDMRSTILLAMDDRGES
jgi:hypothetical protein